MLKKCSNWKRFRGGKETECALFLDNLYKHFEYMYISEYERAASIKTFKLQPELAFGQQMKVLGHKSTKTPCNFCSVPLLLGMYICKTSPCLPQ